MKIYLFLLLISFFTCDLIDKRNEIISNEFINKFLQQMSDIINYACGDDIGCVFSLYREYVSNLNPDELNQLSEFKKNPDCEDTCCQYIFQNIINSYYYLPAGYFCSNMCKE